jgi:hypothetical protein
VAADVLAQHQQRPVGAEQPGRVQPAGAGEHPLGLAQPVRQRRQHRRGDPDPVGGQVIAGPDPDRVDALLAAHPAGTGGEEVPLRAPGVGGAFQGRRDREVRRPEGGVGHVLVAHADLPQVHGRGQQALGEQEPSGQIEVIAGGTHGHGQGLAADPDLQRLLHRQQVGLGPGRAVAGGGDPLDPAPLCPGAHGFDASLAQPAP